MGRDETRSAPAKIGRAILLAFLYSPLIVFNVLVTPLLKDRRRFLDPDEYEHLAPLTQSFATIRSELDSLLAEDAALIPGFADVDDGQTRLAGDGRWKTYVFKVFGQDVPENFSRCPRTAALIGGIPEISMAMFSILEPGKRLPPHFGAFRGVLRYHLPLRIPGERACGIRVGGETRFMEEGEPLLFDDVYLHTAWNESDADRVVLFIDVERRMPYGWLTRVNRWLIAFLARTQRVQTAARNARVDATP